MLEAALRFKKAFTMLAEDEDSNFMSYFKEPEEEYDEDGVLLPSNKKDPKKGRKTSFSSCFFLLSSRG